MNLKIIYYHEPNGICGNLLNVIECLIKRKKKELIYFNFKNLLYSNKFNVWEKFFFQPFEEYQDLIKKKIENKDYTIEKFSHVKYKPTWNYTFHNNMKTLHSKKKIIEQRILVKKFIKFKTNVLNKLKNYEVKYFNKKTLGVHLRGTDKFSKKGHDKFINKRHLLTFEKNIKPLIDRKLNNLELKKIFLATDEKFLFDQIKKEYNYLLLKQNSKIISAKKNIGTHFINVYGHEKWKTQLGLEALTDMIFLSRSNYSLLSQSNLSLCSILLRKDFKFKFIDAHIQ